MPGTGRALLSAVYEPAVSFNLDIKGEGKCAQRTEQYLCTVRHRCIECPYIRHTAPKCFGRIVELAKKRVAKKERKHGTELNGDWSGLLVSHRNADGPILWHPARHAHTAISSLQSHMMRLWPLYHAVVPSKEVVDALSTMCKCNARHSCMGSCTSWVGTCGFLINQSSGLKRPWPIVPCLWCARKTCFCKPTTDRAATTPGAQCASPTSRCGMSLAGIPA